MSKLDNELINMKNIAISGHINPDGDCVGACLGLYNYILKNFEGVNVDVYLEPIPAIFDFLKGSSDIKNQYNENNTYDLYIALDCSDIKRLGIFGDYYKKAKHTLCIDHHITNDESFADVCYIQPHRSSACELLYTLMDSEKINKDIAECIYTGMVTDSGVFQYGSTTSETMNIAGKMMDMGIDFPTIVNRVFFQKTFTQNKMLARAINNAKVAADGKILYSIVTKKEMDECNAKPKDLEGCVSHLRSTKGVVASVLMYQNPEGTFKVSLRSEKETDVASIAAKFGGGGHKNAAGCTILENPEEKMKEIVSMIEKELN
ncbi:phosphoesterase RecJ domain-containing protein [Acetitomaculum ruminis DSM 5522]|uniref:Phosphoesterase RecJ domain-containing protein n=1 Tax=Acetitomaculum ruminis DSM 5522 TaxID=1120918 RepID=A0A1I0XTS5_9FIRM|nr:bifunctional oligoribonuclease/PAP phosphatase NrnA [Acetitomaculum ruminis]SFB03660.1 phosphoesterase RecJ domain-containing protein [Acetitomaculum ruminis DSM 5522]